MQSNQRKSQLWYFLIPVLWVNMIFGTNVKSLVTPSTGVIILAAAALRILWKWDLKILPDSVIKQAVYIGVRVYSVGEALTVLNPFVVPVLRQSSSELHCYLFFFFSLYAELNRRTPGSWSLRLLRQSKMSLLDQRQRSAADRLCASPLSVCVCVRVTTTETPHQYWKLQLLALDWTGIWVSRNLWLWVGCLIGNQYVCLDSC